MFLFNLLVSIYRVIHEWLYRLSGQISFIYRSHWLHHGWGWFERSLGYHICCTICEGNVCRAELYVRTLIPTTIGIHILKTSRITVTDEMENQVKIFFVNWKEVSPTLGDWNIDPMIITSKKQSIIWNNMARPLNIWQLKFEVMSGAIYV